MNQTPIFLCPMGTCLRCDAQRRAEDEARCPLNTAQSATKAPSTTSVTVLVFVSIALGFLLGIAWHVR